MGWIILAVLVALVLVVIGMYNSLVRLRGASSKAPGPISMSAQAPLRPHPNLVETVKAYAAHERARSRNRDHCRAKAMSAQGPEAKGRRRESVGANR